MKNACLCKKHFAQVGNYFDHQLAVEFHLDADRCLVCNHKIVIEEARRFVMRFSPSERLRSAQSGE